MIVILLEYLKENKIIHTRYEKFWLEGNQYNWSVANLSDKIYFVMNFLCNSLYLDACFTHI